MNVQKIVSEGYAVIDARATMSDVWVLCVAAGPLLLLLASGLSE